MMNRDNKPRSTKTTLNSALGQEGRLDISERSVGSKTLNGQDFGIYCISSHDQTRADCFAVNYHRAATAFTLFTCAFRSR